MPEMELYLVHSSGGPRASAWFAWGPVTDEAPCQARVQESTRVWRKQDQGVARNLASAGSLPICLQQPALGQVKGRTWNSIQSCRWMPETESSELLRGATWVLYKGSWTGSETWAAWNAMWASHVLNTPWHLQILTPGFSLLEQPSCLGTDLASQSYSHLFQQWSFHSPILSL